MTRIIMVCLGNICRSPLAEGILKTKLPKDSYFIDSAGTASYHTGNKPDPRSIAIAKKNGIDISNQKARQFSVNDFDHFDFIYPMDIQNQKDILSLARNDEDKLKVKLILNELTESENLSVPDPYYGGDNGFENVYNLLNEACSVIANKLQ